MVSKCNIFILLMWKNWILAKRAWFSTLLELIVPIFFAIFLCWILTLFRSKVDETPLQEFTAFRTYENTTLCFNTSVAAAPESKVTDHVISYILKNCPGIHFTRYKNLQELNKAIHLGDFYAVIHFDNSLKNISKINDLPSDLEITIRIKSDVNGKKREWFTQFMYPQFPHNGPRDSSDTDGEPGYQDRGFLLLQQLITLALLNYNNRSVEQDITMHKYPYPSFVYDKFYDNFSLMLIPPLVPIFLFGFTHSYLLTAITTEKEQQFKESMKVMGLPGWLHWLAWFMRGFIMLFIVIVVLILLLSRKIISEPVFTKSDPTVLLVFLLLFACSVITFTFLISVFFSKAETASVIGEMVFFYTCLPYFIVVVVKRTLSLGVQLGISVLSNSAVCFGMLVIIRFEATEEGAHWSNLWNSVNTDDDLTLGYIMLMLIFDTFLYMMIALYVEAIFPGEFGVPKPWYFPVLCFYRKNVKVRDSDDEATPSNEGEFFEKLTENLPTGIQLENVSKNFGGYVAVKNFNLEMHEGHITVLLGHNGAGKTTVLSMITGMFLPSSGTVIVNGYNIRTDLERARDSMGLCLQHNVLFDNLTVEEHLYFFCKLKGLKGQQLNAEINDYLSLMEFKEKKNAQSKTLSGGMKRKLSVALALCGKSKVVVLDEPTSGMDPSSRRVVWNLIQKEKQGRTILLTTHSMDETDLLGERIAIMSAGELKCCGSSFFLRKKFAAGYYLIMELSPECVPQSITNFLKMYISQVKIHSHVGIELTYHLPETEAPRFEKMLSSLESNSTTLGVLSYGISLATLEQVFMKVGVDRDNKASKTREQNGLEIKSSYKISYLTGHRLISNQLSGMFMKKWSLIPKNWSLFVLQIISPTLFLLFILLSNKTGDTNDFPALKLTLNSYSNPVTLISGDKKNPLYKSYKGLMNSKKLLEVTNITETILTLMKETPRVVKNNYIVGATFDNNMTTAWFNGDPFHSAPLALSLVLNALYKLHLGMEKSISFVNHPLPIDLRLKDKQMLMGFQVAMLLTIGLSFVFSCYIMFYIEERVCKFRHLQYTSGASVFVFWIAALLADLLIYIMSIIAIIITVGALQMEGFKASEEISRLVLILLAFGFFALPCIYLLSNLFSVPGTGFMVFFMFTSLSGYGGLFIVFLLQSTVSTTIIARVINWILLFTPSYAFSKSIFDIDSVNFVTKSCSKYATPEHYCTKLNITVCCDIKNYFSMEPPGIGSNILISFSMFILFYTFLFVIELSFFTFVLHKLLDSNKVPRQFGELDSDVYEENKKIKSASEDVLKKQYCLVLRDVTKYYKGNPAVNGLCLGVKPFECFGLLGINGAGKTTTFKMLTGDVRFSYGDAWVNGLSIKSQRSKVQKLIGYCPQFDALLDDLTVRKTLQIFALIRGIPRDKCKEIGEELAQELNFSKYIDKQIKHLSGGTKRKVNTALAVIGEPPVIYLDEPTTGMDPVSRRQIWSHLLKLRDRGKSIVLVSHSMEECEAFCTRIAIMVNGNFQCLGSVQHLKKKFAQGYVLTLKMKRKKDVVLDDDTAAVDRFIEKYFPQAELKERYQELFRYQLPSSTMPWSQIFGLFESHKKQLNIEDYSIGQCSLEEVFLSFTKYQQQVED